MQDRRWLALAVLVLVRVAMGFQFQSAASIGPLLVAELGIDYAALGTLVGAYLLPGIVVALPGGWLGNRFGDVRLVTFGLVLMALGGGVGALAGSYGLLLAGRLAAGVGAVLLNVFLAKLTTDLFSGRQLVIAMGWLLSAWPFGIGLALLTLGWVGEAFGAATALAATAAAALVSLGLMLTAYPRASQAGGAAATGSDLSTRELGATLVAGAMWGLFNAALVIVLAFAPGHLLERGYAIAEAGWITSLLSWTIIPALPLGAYVAARLGGPGIAITACCLAAALVIGLVPALEAPYLAFAFLGFAFGPPGSLIMSLPAQALRAQNRALGMGVYYTVYYVGMAALPALAGWTRDLTGASTAPLYLAGALMVGVALALPFFHVLKPAAARA